LSSSVAFSPILSYLTFRPHRITIQCNGKPRVLIVSLTARLSIRPVSVQHLIRLYPASTSRLYIPSKLRVHRRPNLRQITSARSLYFAVCVDFARRPIIIVLQIPGTLYRLHSFRHNLNGEDEENTRPISSVLRCSPLARVGLTVWFSFAATHLINPSSP
jgi:hypothetical protein